MNISPLHLVDLEVFCHTHLCWPAVGWQVCVPSPLRTALPVTAHEVNCKICPILSSETFLALLEEEESEEESVSFLTCEIYD